VTSSPRARLTRLHRRALVAVATDMTATTATRSALVLAPHPDDETIGCGATIARKAAAGTPVRVVVAADGGDARRRGECIDACARLGVGASDVVFLGFPDGDLEHHRNDLDARVRELVVDTNADEVFAPAAIDAHPDHRWLAASVEALRHDELASTSVLTYPIWYWNRWAWVDRATPRWLQAAQLAWRPLAATARARPRIVSAREFGTLKRAALDAHASQVDADAAGAGSEVLDPEWLALFLGDDELFFSEWEAR